ncbi:MAG: SDR family NAD(P)-dependent oxidoreductase [bacterium]
MRLKDKVAIITGGSSGIGLATAKKFIAEGAKVVIADINRETGEKAEQETGAMFIKTDVSDSGQVQNLINKTIEKYGQLDIMINNAGVAVMGSALDCPDEDFERVISINLRGVFLGTKYAAQKMKDKGGVILNTASVAGLVGFNGAVGYCASKGGIVQVTKAAALDLAQYKIRVNAIAPAVIKTAMTKGFIENPDYAKMFLAQTPLGRFGEPEEVANLICFLASDEASYITGSIYPVDGGWTAV